MSHIHPQKKEKMKINKIRAKILGLSSEIRKGGRGGKRVIRSCQANQRINQNSKKEDRRDNSKKETYLCTNSNSIRSTRRENQSAKKQQRNLE